VKMKRVRWGFTTTVRKLKPGRWRYVISLRK
jgi:hypothetical protein